MLSMREVMISISAWLMGGGSSDWDTLFVTNVGTAVSTGMMVSIAELFSLTAAIDRSLVDMVELGLGFECRLL